MHELKQALNFPFRMQPLVDLEMDRSIVERRRVGARWLLLCHWHT